MRVWYRHKVLNVVALVSGKISPTTQARDVCIVHVICESMMRRLDKALTQLAFYAGWPNVFSAMPVFKDVFAKRKE